MINDHSYQVAIKPHIISKNLWRFIFTIHMFGLVLFILQALIDKEKRQTIIRSPKGMVQVWIQFLNPPLTASERTKNGFIPPITLLNASANAILSAYLLVFMEWLFTITKPSVLDSVDFSKKVEVFFIASLVVSLVALSALVIVIILDFLLKPIFPVYRKFAIHFPASFLISCLGLLLIDNFTYTIFNFGIFDAKLVMNLLYGFGLLLGIVFIAGKLSAMNPLNRKSGMTKSIIAVSLLAPSLFFAVLAVRDSNPVDNLKTVHPLKTNRPNIVLLSSDALSANNMSLYGYERDTTPFLRELANSSLIGQSHFSNSNLSTGSETSILTGKLPITTHVLYPPDILQGQGAYEHLPGILKSRGYLTTSLGVDYYIDARVLNLQNGFDYVNCTKVTISPLSGLFSGHDQLIFFLQNTADRLFNRISHIYYLHKIQNPFDLVTQSETSVPEDQRKLECFRSELEEAVQNGTPLFAHIHLMGTHGEYYFPESRVFSAGRIQGQPKMTDFYDDAIRDFDQYVQQVVQDLTEAGIYDNTILVIYTDHPNGNDPRDRIPVLINFPGGAHAGIITANTQNIDIAPTILDYMGIAPPDWMEGISLLKDVDPGRLLIAAEPVEVDFNKAGEPVVPKDKLNPPFYQFGKLIIIQCQTWFSYDLKGNTITKGEIENHKSPCLPGSLESEEGLRKKIGEMLVLRGFDLPDDW